MRRLILQSFQSPGDILMLTAAVRELHSAHPGRFQTAVRTSAPALWENNPFVTKLADMNGGPGPEALDVQYPLIHHSNSRPVHFLQGYVDFLSDRLNVPLSVTRFHGDIHLSAEEKREPPAHLRLGASDRFWIIVAGGKYDFTAKWWNPQSYQAVVDHFRGRIQFVQCGDAEHWHPRLDGVIDLVGRTSLRDLICLTHFADGVVCPVTFAMHLAAAVETVPGRPRRRACVVIAGGREPPHWEAYPNHQFMSTNGALSCCADGGCWRSRCQKVGDGDTKDFTNLCEQPVQVTSGLSIPRCMDMISPADVIRRIEMYFEGGSLEYLPAASRNDDNCAKSATTVKANGARAESDATPRGSGQRLDVSFYHGLGDCVYFAHLIRLYARRGYDIGVECTPDKSILFEAAGARVLKEGEAESVHAWGYPPGGTAVGHGQFRIGSKIGHNLSEPPFPDIGPKDELWDELVAEQIRVDQCISDEDRNTVRTWLNRLQRPITLLHSKGNTAQERKSLPDSIASKFYCEFLDRCEGTLILLDWDRRVPRLASSRMRHLEELGKCTLERLFALMLESDLLIGVDSGPLHTSRLTEIPTIGLWMPGHYPATYTLPRSNQLNLVLRDHTHQWNRFKRVPWRIVEHPGDQFDAKRLADYCRLMQNAPRYLQADRAADVQMQQFILDWCRCQGGGALAGYWDRNRSFDVLFREIAARFEDPLIVETGTIRAEEDWAGAGFFTYLAGFFVSHHGGELHSVDITPEHCRFARSWTEVLGSHVHVHEMDSISFLHDFNRRVDVLYLDSLDTTEPNHAQHALLEFQAIERCLHESTIVVIDDSPWQSGGWVGKGALVIPHLLEQGWKVLYAGYQMVLSRNERVTSDEGLSMQF